MNKVLLLLVISAPPPLREDPLSRCTCLTAANKVGRQVGEYTSKCMSREPGGEEQKYQGGGGWYCRGSREAENELRRQEEELGRQV